MFHDILGLYPIDAQWQTLVPVVTIEEFPDITKYLLDDQNPLWLRTLSLNQA